MFQLLILKWKNTQSSISSKLTNIIQVLEKIENLPVSQTWWHILLKRTEEIQFERKQNKFCHLQACIHLQFHTDVDEE